MKPVLLKSVPSIKQYSKPTRNCVAGVMTAQRYQRTRYLEVVKEAIAVSCETLAVAERADDKSGRIAAVMSLASVFTARYQRAGGDQITEEARGLWHFARTKAEDPPVRCRLSKGCRSCAPLSRRANARPTRRQRITRPSGLSHTRIRKRQSWSERASSNCVIPQSSCHSPGDQWLAPWTLP
jgi:hypothetical protein